MSDVIAVVFGAGSGIGEAICNKLRSADPHICVVAPDSSEIDVRDEYQIKKFFAMESDFRREETWIVYSAGVNYLEWLGKANLSEMKRVVDTNLMGFINVLNSARRFARHGERYRVVSVSSDAAVRPMRTSISYCASKAGQEMAMRVAARELGPQGWAVNSVAPGMTEGTNMTAYVDWRVPEVRGWTEEFTKEYEQQQAVLSDRILRDDIADLVWDVLHMPMSVNGATFTINGGRS